MSTLSFHRRSRSWGQRGRAAAPRIALSVHFVLVHLALAATAAPAGAQYFGRNKVQWERFDFKVLETEHFRVHYYPADNQAAIDASRMAERWYARLARLFGELPQKSPIILYNDQADFRQTTIVGGLIGEGVGGLTEPLRSRLVMPVTGVYADTDHVMGHELVHVFQFATAEALGGSRGGVALATLPLFLVEGLAEYLSLGSRHPQTAMFLRDALVEENLPDDGDLERMRLSPYRFGHAFWAYVGGRWGDDAVLKLFVTALGRGPQAAYEEVLGVTREELWSDWRGAIASDYREQVARRRPPGEQARPVFPPREDEGPIDVAPALSPDGRRIAFLSSRALFGFDVYVADVESGRIERKLTSTRTDPHFDALRFLDSAGAWSPDGEKFCVVVFAKGDNHLAILDVDSGKVECRLRVPGVNALSDPAWSPDGRRLAVSGAEKGVTDLYVVDVASGDAARLTRDAYADLQPAWSPDGRRVAWITDRGPGTDLVALAYGPTQIAMIEVADAVGADAASGRGASAGSSDASVAGGLGPGGTIELVPLLPEGDHTNPQFAPDGRSLYFLGNPDGVRNVYVAGLDGAGEIRRLTDVYTGVAGITELSPALSVAAGTGALAFSVYLDSRYLLYTLDPARGAGEAVDPSTVARLDAAVLPPADRAAADTVVDAYVTAENDPAPLWRAVEVRDYRPRFSLLTIRPPVIGAGVDSYGLGLGGAVSAYFGDTLGRHQLGVSFEGGVSSDDFGSNFGVAATYLNRSHRLNWGASAGRVPYVAARTAVGQSPVVIDGTTVVADVVEQIREEVVLEQVGLITQYPFSLTRRLEAGAFLTRQSIDREIETVLLVGDAVLDSQTENLPSPDDLDLGQGYLAYVRDTSAFAFTSPVAGTRYRLEVGTTAGTLEYQTALADFRRYFLFKPASFAMRALHYGRYGGDAESDRLAPLFVGRETLVRGYTQDSFSAAECASGGGVSCPVFDRLIGDRIGVVNLELRLQVLGTADFGLGRAPFLPLELAAFLDVGAAWDEDTSVELEFDRDSLERVPVASAGLAARILVAGYLPIELYAAYPLHRPDEDVNYGFLITPGW